MALATTRCPQRPSANWSALYWEPQRRVLIPKINATAVRLKWGSRDRDLAGPDSASPDTESSASPQSRPSVLLQASSLKRRTEAAVCSRSHARFGILSWRCGRGAESRGHCHQVGEGIGFHLPHDTASVRLYRDLANAQVAPNLFVQKACHH